MCSFERRGNVNYSIIHSWRERKKRKKEKIIPPIFAFFLLKMGRKSSTFEATKMCFLRNRWNEKLFKVRNNDKKDLIFQTYCSYFTFVHSLPLFSFFSLISFLPIVVQTCTNNTHSHSLMHVCTHTHACMRTHARTHAHSHIHIHSICSSFSQRKYLFPMGQE